MGRSAVKEQGEPGDEVAAGEEVDAVALGQICDQKAMTLSCDRSRSGLTDFSDHFKEIAVAPVRRKLTSMRIFIDNSSIEVFGNDGEVCLTSLVFPTSPLTGISVTRY